MSFQICIYIKDTCHQLSLESDTTVTIGGGKCDTLSLPDSGMAEEQFSFTSRHDSTTLQAKTGVFAKGAEITNAEVSVGDIFTCKEAAVYICPKQSDYDHAVHLSTDREYVVGRSKVCTFCLSNQRISSRHAKITFESGKYRLTDLESKNHTFVNGRRISTHYLKDGDRIQIGCYEIVYEQGELTFFNTGADLRLNLDAGAIMCRYPYFRRSPRLGAIYDPQPIEVQAPPNICEKPQINWFTVLLPPLVMVGVSVASMLLSGGSMMTLLYLLPMTLVTLFTTIIAYTSQVRKYRKEKIKKEESYQEYVEQICSKVEEAYQQQHSIINRANPETSYCYDIVSERMRRLWERAAEDEDFLEVRLGKGMLPLRIELRLPMAGIGEEIHPELLRLQDFLKNMGNVKDIAITLPLKRAGAVGVVGNRQVGIKVVQNAVVQLTTHHSYGELKLALIADERSYGDWSWIRWLPHTWSDSHHIRFVSSDKKQAAELLEYFEDILKKRMDAVSQKRYQENSLLPHLVFIITDPVLTEGREFLRLLASFGTEVGASAFLLFDSINKLPKECDWFVEVNNSGGSVYAKSDSGDKRMFTLDAFEEYEKFARAMSPIRDRDAGRSSNLPPSVTFFQGYGITDVTDLHILQRWAAARPYQSLAVPIGEKENGKAFLFDIHEKAHGPHGLVAGTTGAGKSEVLQTYILSMCANFSPQDVSFVLIDFKGSGLAGALKGLPHVAGVITDMDENIQRNLFSLEAEIERRKKLFADVSNEERKLQDIYEYQKEYYSGGLSEPLSHLIVVIDEFTELKSRFPDFMEAVERASRVGRTLGIHLILATQKPGGSVSDEIRANSNFKWCLRVKEGESKEVLGRADAEGIPQEYPGRAYIQVGNNEIFELVQTYYSGADICKKGEDHLVQVSFVNPMGHREMVKIGQANEQTVQGKELLSLVKHISSQSEEMKIPAARKIWENSLPTRFTLSEIPDTKSESLLSAVIGLIDDPRHQQQYPCAIDFDEGHMIIYGASGTGKTTLLQTLILSLAEHYTPEEVHIYVMDFGSWSMKNLQDLPHVGDVANGNEKEKLINLVRMLTEELDGRKLLFAGSNAGNFKAYRQISQRALPAILTVIDNFAPIREAYPEIEDALIRLSREGSGFGMYFVVTASALSGNISYQMSQNFRQAIALQMVEKADYRDIVGDTEGLEPSKAAGRGLVRGKPPMEFQTALAVPAENQIEYLSHLKLRCEQLALKWRGSIPRKIPVMPDIVMFEDIKDALTEGIVLGLSEDAITPIMIPWDSRLMLISGTEGSGKTNMLEVIARQLTGRCKVVKVNVSTDPNGEEKIAEAVRQAEMGEVLTLVIDDIPGWLSGADYEVADALEDLIRDQKNNAFTLYASGDAAELVRTSSGILNRMFQSKHSILLGGSFSEHSSQFEANNVGYSWQEEMLLPNYGYFIWRKKAVLFKALFGGGGNSGL